MMNLDGFDQPMFGVSSMPRKAVKGLKQQGKGGTLTSLISEGGAAGGALAGAAAGSVVPVVGTAIGGILGAGIGAFAGRMAENKVRDDRWGLSDAAQEGALSAVLTGPLKLGKYAATAGKSVGKVGLEEALKMGADDAAKFSLRGTAGRSLDKAATNYATKQFGLTDSFLAKYKKELGEDAGKVIQRHGVSTVDDIEKQVAKQDDIFNTLIENTGPIKKSAIQSKLYSLADDLAKQAPKDQKIAGQKLRAEADQLFAQFGDEIPATELNKFKQQYASLVNYDAKVANKAGYDTNRRVAGVLREAIQDASGSKQLKETGMEMTRLIRLAEEAEKRMPAVASRAASPVGLRNTLGFIAGGGATGGMLGGFPGAVVGAGVTAAANSPKGRQAIFKGVNKAAGMAAGPGKPASPLGMAGSALAGQPIEGMLNQPQGSNAQGLEEALLSQSQSEGPSNIQSMLPTAMTPAMSSNGMGASYPNSQQMSSGAASGITRENILKAMMIDLQETGGKNFDKIQMIYEFANPEPANPLTLSDSAIGTINDFDTGLSLLDNLEGTISNSGAVGPIMGRLRGLNPYDTEAKSIDAEALKAAQVIGKALEGGKLAEGDIARYRKLLPQATDSREVALNKISLLRNQLARQSQGYSMMQQSYGKGAGSIEEALLAQGGLY